MAARDDEPPGAWVFLSHSHRDLEKVRLIRNELEAMGHNPLMFFLKCLDDDSEVDGLIRREIEARTWFILCQSPNARASRWVQGEVAIITHLAGKVYEEIDLDDDLETQIERVAALAKRATAFISAARGDAHVASRLRGALLENDFQVFFDRDDMAPRADWRKSITDAIDHSLDRGFFLLLLSPEALGSSELRFHLQELHEALVRRAGTEPRAKGLLGLPRRRGARRRSNVVPIIVREREATLGALDDLPEIADLEVFDLTEGDLNERIADLIEHLKTRRMD